MVDSGLRVVLGSLLLVAAARLACAAAPPAAPQYLLTPTLLEQARSKAAAGTPQWQAFVRRLDAELDRVTPGTYQGGSLTWAGDFALAYQVLRDSDPVRASRYADKAIAILSGALHSDLKGNWGTRALAAVADGSTGRFSLPHDNINPRTLKLWVAPVKTKTLTRGNTPDAQDSAASYSHFLKVWDDRGEYQKGVDWRKNPDYRDDMLDWSLPGREPAAGSSYSIAYASASGASLLTSGYVLAGKDLVFTTPPAANQAIFVEYQYGVFTQGQSTLGYQQTSDGRGGYNNILIDNGYSSRYLKYLPMAMDWLWDYRGLSPLLRSQATELMVRWSDRLREKAYKANSPASNYGAGHYAFRVAAAIALQGRSPEATRLAAEVVEHRRRYLLPVLQRPTGGVATLFGGHWAEGWNYGPLSIRNLLTAGMALEAAGMAQIGPERQWAGDVVKAMLHEQPTQATIYDGGDGYAWPLPAPDKTLWTDLAYFSSDADARAFGNWAIQQYPGTILAGWEDLLYRDPRAAARPWTGQLPLSYLAEGTGLGVARKDWSYASTWLSFQSGNLAPADHQAYAQGQLTIQRGSDALLVNSAAVSSLQGLRKSQWGNLVLVDDGGAGEQTYRNSQGVWYGDPGCRMESFEEAGGYTYMRGDYAAAYRKNYGGRNPAKELVRSVLYVRQTDYIIVYDRVTTTQPTHLKQLQWHFNGTPAVQENAWTVSSRPARPALSPKIPATPRPLPRRSPAAAGRFMPPQPAVGSRLFGATFSTSRLRTAAGAITLKTKQIQQIAVNNADAAPAVRYVTAMQVAPEATPAMSPCSHIVSADAALEGVRIGPVVALFGRNGAVAGRSSYRFTPAHDAITTHYVADVAPGSRYSLSGADQAVATASNGGILSFTTRGKDEREIVLTPVRP